MQNKGYFTLQELIRSTTAGLEGIDNTPTPAITKNLKNLIGELNKIRQDYGKPIYVNSGYRCIELNKKVGGVPTSDHTLGCAVDLSTRLGQEEDKKLYNLIKTKHPFNQLIWEGTWIHYSLYPTNKNQAF